VVQRRAVAWTGRPHVDGAGPGVVHGRPGGATPALADSRCSGAVANATTDRNKSLYLIFVGVIFLNILDCF
jgi:hypothetical protein